MSAKTDNKKADHKPSQQQQTLENILLLQSLRDKLQGADLLSLDAVLQDLRESVGDTVSKTNAAQMLDVSRQTVERWVQKDLLPAVRGKNGRQQIPRQAVERLTEEVRSLRSVGQSRAVVAKALRSVADELDLSEEKKDTSPKAKKTQVKKTKAKKPAKSSAKKTRAKKQS